MTVRLGFLDDKDQKWYVEAGGFPDAIIVPLGTIEDMTAEEIGAMVLALAPEIDYAHTVLLLDKYHLHDPNRFDDDTIQNDIEKCERYAERDSQLCELELKLRAELDKRLLKAIAKEMKKHTRDELRTVYEKRFVEIGRRDGFECCVCGSTSPDLQIDHIVPVSLGGSNEPENLCLLCPSCNRKKGTMNHDEFLEEMGVSA